MTDKHDDAAAAFMAQYGYGDSYARDDLADLLRFSAIRARAEAFEEIADAFKNMPAVAAAIRAAKDKP